MALGPLLGLLVLGTGALCSAPSGPWDAFNFAPASRTVYPTSIRQTSGNVSNANSILSNSSLTLSGDGSYVTLDFGFEVGGIVSLNFDEVSDDSSVALSFTESPLFINPLASDDSVVPSANMSYDGVLHVAAPLPAGHWTQPAAQMRGGFRFLTIALTSDSSVSLSNVSCELNFMPHVDSLRNYSGYFYAADPDFVDPNFLTRVWYAGAYTVQINTIPHDRGRTPNTPSPGMFLVIHMETPLIPLLLGWENDAPIGNTGAVLVDGAKRDRSVWPGDLGISLPTQFVSTNDLITTRNALDTLYALQNAAGALPYSGPPLSLELGSDTYHAWTLIGTYNYVLYSGDVDWLQGLWSNYTRGVEYLAEKVDETGLLNVTGVLDWGRIGQGGHNAEANAIYYKLLASSADLALWLNDTDLASAYAANASALKPVFNDAFWQEDRGMYRDNLTTTFCAQDANALAILFNLTDSAEQAAAVSEGLTANWGVYGAVAPELPDTIAPFIGGFEVQAHFVAGEDARALDLLHREWGYMLYTPLSVQSTMLEGYTSNGSLYFRSTEGYNYDASYTSHAHGWSTGPTSALSFYVLGLQVTAPQGRTWAIAPHTAGLPYAEGGYETPLGWFGIKWALDSEEGWWNATVSTPEGTRGSLKPPVNGTVSVDGEAAEVDGFGVLQLSGGSHVVIVQIAA
ncbi:Six-hairpin glycosidase [Fomitopsis serialis]|uniref:Six-hairpin glycosidase n=1 Tax=Fomitopsis serialis TaxID=139415 RepID=UPI0020087473|nr:Six-hairpin glycosidase [Neoantrodia serialis]KAH9930196.1 Six-hairpin glycosidase [Neoantrodia serialis]